MEQEREKEAYLLHLVRSLGIFCNLYGCHLLLGGLLSLDGGRHFDDDVYIFSRRKRQLLVLWRYRNVLFSKTEDSN